MKSKNLGLVGAVLTSAALTFSSPYSYCADSIDSAKTANSAKTFAAISETKSSGIDSYVSGKEKLNPKVDIVERTIYYAPDPREQEDIELFQKKYPNENNAGQTQIEKQGKACNEI